MFNCEFLNNSTNIFSFSKIYYYIFSYLQYYFKKVYWYLFHKAFFIKENFIKLLKIYFMKFFLSLKTINKFNYVFYSFFKFNFFKFIKLLNLKKLNSSDLKFLILKLKSIDNNNFFSKKLFNYNIDTLKFSFLSNFCLNFFSYDNNFSSNKFNISMIKYIHFNFNKYIHLGRSSLRFLKKFFNVINFSKLLNKKFNNLISKKNYEFLFKFKNVNFYSKKSFLFKTYRKGGRKNRR